VADEKHDDDNEQYNGLPGLFGLLSGGGSGARTVGHATAAPEGWTRQKDNVSYFATAYCLLLRFPDGKYLAFILRLLKNN
jgi:hypothetical protein